MTKQHFIAFVLSVMMGVIGATAFLTKVDAKEDSGKEMQQKMQTQLLNISASELDQNEYRYSVNVQKKEFEIKGAVNAFSDNSVTINSQLVNLNPEITGPIHLKGKLVNGEKIKIEGIVRNGEYYAHKISMIGTGQGRDKSEIGDLEEDEEEDIHEEDDADDDETTLPTTTPSPSPTPIPTASPVPTITPSQSPSPSPSITPNPSANPDGLSQLLLQSHFDNSIETGIDLDERVTLLEDMGIEFDKLWVKIYEYLNGLVKNK